MTGRDDPAFAFRLNAAFFLRILAAGIAGELVFEFIAWVIAPPLLGRPMQPALLVGELSKSILGLELPSSLAFTAHTAIGAVLFPLAYAVFRSVFHISDWRLGGLLWGVTLWIVAQAVLAPLAGRPFFLGFTGYTWASLLAHIAQTTTIAFVLERFSARRDPHK